MLDRSVDHRLPVAVGRPLVGEAVLQVVGDVVEFGLDRLVLALRILVREGIAVAVGLEAVERHRDEVRLLVVDRDVQHLSRRIARHLDAGILLCLAEHDGERVVLARVVGREAVKHREGAIDEASDLGDREAYRSRRGRRRVRQNRLRARAAEHRGVHVAVAEQECVDRLLGVVLGAERDPEVHRVAFDVVVGIGVEAGRARRLRGSHVHGELDDLALLAADRRNDLDLRRLRARRGVLHRRRVAAREPDELAALAARLEPLGEGRPAGRRARLDAHLIACVHVRHVRVRVLDGDVDLELLARRHFIDARDVRGRDDRLRGADPHARSRDALDAGCRLLLVADVGRELQLVPRADGVRVAAEGIDVDRLRLG